MPSLNYIVVVVIFTLLASEVLCEQAKFPKSSDTDKMCPYNTEMSDELRRNFTDMHNYRRSQLALGHVINKNKKYLPAASDMIKLEWDCCLERNATEHVRKCPDGGSDESERPRIGELYKRVPVSGFFPVLGDYKHAIWEAITGWWKIARHVSVDECIGDDAVFRKDLVGKDIHTFTQMAWAKTTRLGCAIGICPKKATNEKEFLVVCRYFPKGNNEDEIVYKPGPACSSCPKGYACTTPSHCDQQNCQGLCV